jgi:hypothetical protein
MSLAGSRAAATPLGPGFSLLQCWRRRPWVGALWSTTLQPSRSRFASFTERFGTGLAPGSMHSDSHHPRCMDSAARRKLLAPLAKLLVMLLGIQSLAQSVFSAVARPRPACKSKPACIRASGRSRQGASPDREASRLQPRIQTVERFEHGAHSALPSACAGTWRQSMSGHALFLASPPQPTLATRCCTA